MKVKKLIELLSKCDPEANVELTDSENAPPFVFKSKDEKLVFLDYDENWNDGLSKHVVKVK